MKKEKGMKKLLVVVLTLAMAMLTVNAFAAEETQCDFLKGEGKGLFGLCMAYCEAHDGPADITTMSEEDLAALNPSSLVLFDLFEKKAGVDGPELPCVNYIGECPVWTQEELDRIGTLGGTFLQDHESEQPPYWDMYYDSEQVGSLIRHYAQVVAYSYTTGIYIGRYISTNTGYPDAERVQYITEDEYNACKQQVIDHVTCVAGKPGCRY
ncbi:hypothetical protein ACFLZQ_07635 [Thermodesulfobacteriota bacterium]